MQTAVQTPSILRNGTAIGLSRANSTKSILKRPMPLTLSPSANQTASFSALFSASARGLRSPHVHFPPSPSKLHATYIVHSSVSYDRAPISVSPNLVNLPGWGERVYSPSIEGFKSFSSPKPFRSFSYQVPSPVVTDFVDPRSLKIPAPSIVISGPDGNGNRRSVQFAQSPRPSKSLSTSLASYPRSPFPSAPTADADMESEMEMDHRGRQLARDDPVVDGPTRARARANSLEEKKRNKRNIKGLALDSSALVNDNLSRKSKVVVENGSAVPFTPIPSSILGRGVFSPAVASINRRKKPAALPLDSLTQQFWASMTLASNSNASNASKDSSSMVTAPEFPESAVEYDERLDMTLRSAAQPEIMYGNADGTVYSPALPVPGFKTRF
jgi:hypothetical protein